MNPILRSLPLLTLALGAAAQTVVDFDTSTLASPPAAAFPFYTPGAGSTGQTVRVQCLCPTWFLAAQNVGPGIVTHVGLSLAGQATYSTFQLRAGASSVGALTDTWDTNLPDQRVQLDLANVPITGGGTAQAPQNQWVEFELAHPFVWQPGQDVVVDLTTRLLVPGQYLGTTTSPNIGRAYTFDFQGQSTAASVTAASGFVFRLRLQPLHLLPFGQGCAVIGGTVATLSSSGSMAVGSTDLSLDVAQAAPTTIGAFLLGFSRTAFAGGALPFAYGGGCSLLVSPDAAVTVVSSPVGTSALPVPVPGWPELAGLAIHAQFAHFEPQSPANVPAVFSAAGSLLLH
jgi:hypothetical protein